MHVHVRPTLSEESGRESGMVGGGDVPAMGCQDEVGMVWVVDVMKWWNCQESLSGLRSECGLYGKVRSEWMFLLVGEQMEYLEVWPSMSDDAAAFKPQVSG